MEGPEEIFSSDVVTGCCCKAMSHFDATVVGAALEVRAASLAGTELVAAGVDLATSGAD